MTGGRNPVLVSALVVPHFKENLISVVQLAKATNILFTSQGVYLLPLTSSTTNATLIGGRGLGNLYTLSTEFVPDTSSMRATFSTLHKPANQELHQTLNHSHPEAIEVFKKSFPNAAAHIINALSKKK